MGNEAKLLGTWSSHYSYRVKLALTLKGVAYVYEEEDLKNKSSLLQVSNPVHKKVPVLIHKGKAISESLIILEYIDETWQSPLLLPTDPLERAKARFLSSFIDEKVTKTGINCLTMSDAEFLDKSHEFFEQLEFLQDELRGKEYFGGESIGFLDIVAFPVIYLLQIGEEVAGRVLMSGERFAEIGNWRCRVSEIDAVRESLSDRETLTYLVRSRLEHLRALRS